MRDSTEAPREVLLVDHETGVVLDCPALAVVSGQYLDSHPFIEIFEKHGERFVVVGPDAVKVGAGVWGEDYVLYRVEAEIAGTFRLVRVS